MIPNIFIGSNLKDVQMNECVHDFKNFIISKTNKFAVDLSEIKSQFIKDSLINWKDEDFTVRVQYNRNNLLRKKNNAVTRVRRFINRYKRYIPWELFDSITNQIDYLIHDIIMEDSLINSKQTRDAVAKENDIVFTGIKSMWFEKPLEYLLANDYKRIHDGDFESFYKKYSSLKADHIGTPYGDIPKNGLLALLNQIRLIIEGSSTERMNRGIYSLHSKYQISPRVLSSILHIYFSINCRDTCVMKKSTIQFEKEAETPQWLVNYVDHLGNHLY